MICKKIYDEVIFNFKFLAGKNVVKMGFLFISMTN